MLSVSEGRQINTTKALWWWSECECRSHTFKQRLVLSLSHTLTHSGTDAQLIHSICGIFIGGGGENNVSQPFTLTIKTKHATVNSCKPHLDFQTVSRTGQNVLPSAGETCTLVLQRVHAAASLNPAQPSPEMLPGLKTAPMNQLPRLSLTGAY